MVSVLQSKDIDWRTGLKNKSQSLVAYKKCTSLAKTSTSYSDRRE
jgi:hypothetical protein